MIKLFNVWYFVTLIITALIVIGLYFLLRKKSSKTIKIVISCLLFFNLAVHFTKFFIEPYSSNPEILARDIWFINICGISVLTFPFIYLSKSDTAKDFMFYLGVISGFLALIYPTEALNKTISLDVIRFYICHIIIFVAPLLMVLTKNHKLNYKRVWKMPFCMLCVLLLIVVMQIIQSELGYVALRNNNFLDPNYRNNSLIWGPTDDIAILFSWATPEFMKVVPFGEYVGQTKYWPVLWLCPSMFIYFWVLPFILCLPWEARHIKKDFADLKNRIKEKKNINKEKINS